jgi:alkylation response protein AidB-like acyl-CoA dehydrogenase
MTDSSDDILSLLADSAGSFVADRYADRPPRLDLDAPWLVDRGRWAEMADLGWLGLAVPEALGGLDAGFAAATTLAEVLGRSAVPEPLVAAAIMPGVLLSRCAEESPLAARLAETVVNGSGLVTLAWQEAAGVIFHAAPTARLTGARVTGTKVFVPVAEDDAMLVVWATDGTRPVLVAVDAGGPGVEVARQSGGLMTMATVRLKEAPILDDAVLLAGPAAADALAAALEAGRVAASAYLCGLAAGVLDKTVAYVNERVQFGRPIGSFQTIQHRCVDYRMAIMLAGAAWRNAARAVEADPLSAAAAAAISAAKARCGDAAMTASKGAVQMHGAMGFTEEGGVGPYLRAAMQMASWLGNSTAHRRRFLDTAA